jgi:cytochrome P450
LLGDAKPAAPAECPDMLAALERAQGSEAKQALLRRWLDDNDTALRFWTLVERKGGLRVELPSADSKGGQAWSFVADPRLARDILADDGAKFSVCEYARRMRGTTGDFFLGMDPVGPERSNEPSRYDHESRARAIVPTDAASLEATRAAAERASLGYLQTLPLRLQGQEAKRFALVELLAVMLNEVATSAFGVPGPSVASLATWGGDIARYHFRLAADETDAAKVKQSTLDYRAHVERLIGEAGNPVYAGSDTLKRVLAKLEESLGAYATDDAKARNLLGVLTGSLGATIALTSNGLLAYAATHTDGKVEWPRAGRLYDAIIAEPLVKVRRGGPDSLYRKYIGPDDHSYKTQSGQPVPLRHGDLVLAWIGGALPEMGADFLYGDGRHQCPGRAMAKHMIEGVLGVLSQLSVRLFAVGPDVVVELLEIDEIARLTRVEV